MAGERSVAVSAGVPGQMYVNAQSGHSHPQPTYVQERHDTGHGKPIHSVRYEPRHGHGQSHHRAEPHYDERHAKQGYRHTRHESRSHGGHQSGEHGIH